MNELLWQADKADIENSNLRQFTNLCEENTKEKFPNYDALHKWSVANSEMFWSYLWDYCQVIGKKGDIILQPNKEIYKVKFFPKAKLSFAENLLKHNKLFANEKSIIFKSEDKIEKSITWHELTNMVSRLQQAFLSANIKSGERIVAMLPNSIEAVACMLAANSIGAVWSSCSPDFGEQGALERFMQIEPKLFIGCNGYWYNGKKILVLEKNIAIAKKLSVPCIIVPYLENVSIKNSQIKNSVSLYKFLQPFKAKEIEYKKLPFHHPLYILFSSGTTGKPKCIVHGQGGTLLKHLSEHVLHCNIRAKDRVFYFTTCGWMMWNWLVSSLAVGATLVLYDGSPLSPNNNVLFDYIDKAKINLFGTSAKFIDSMRNANINIKKTHNLQSVKMIVSTGSPLSAENFKFVYEKIKQDVHLASVSGGTDIIGCFVIGVLSKAVYAGEIQASALGLDVGVFNESGENIIGKKGELVCKNAFVSMPLGFWRDEKNKKYKQAYFAKYKNVWCHGDFAKTTKNGGMVIFGRSDATLNAGGVRIGTAEIYNCVESLQEIEESICIGQKIESDVRIVLFVKLAKGFVLDEKLKLKIKGAIKQGASPRHVPKIILAVKDIPRTRSNKITELAVSDIVHGQEVKNKQALLNPQALDYFKDLPELKI